jgi:hypothetical protein
MRFKLLISRKHGEAWRPDHTLGGGMYTADISQTKRRPLVLRIKDVLY